MPVSAVPLGFTFSFPVEQTALASGKILTWTKGFSARNAIGNDVVKLLQDAFDRKHLHVRCVALVNDVGSMPAGDGFDYSRSLQTVGALLSRAYTAGGCVLGAIFGTGTNGAYLESVSSITKLADAASVPGSHMVINTEWGAFNNTRTVLPSTIYDNKLNRESINPGFQAFEKFISGMYLGEITRNALLALIDAAPRPLLFGGRASKALNEHYGVDTAFMSAVEEAWEGTKEDSKEDIREEVQAVEAQAEPASATAADPADNITSQLKETHLGATPLTPSAHPGSGVTTTASLATDTKPSSKLNVPPLFEEGVKETLEHVDDHMRARLERVRKVLVTELGIPDEGVSLRDAAVVRYVASLVAKRAASLSACAVAAVAVQQKAAQLGPQNNAGFKGERIAVGVDGSLIQFYPNFELHLREALRGLVGEAVEKTVEIGMAKDGSGVGGECSRLCRAGHSADAAHSGPLRVAGDEAAKALEAEDCTMCMNVPAALHYICSFTWWVA
jgi:hexokinase